MVLGGGFCGLFVAKQLEKKLKDKKILLIDRKDCFEFIPSIHKAVTNPSYAARIAIKYEKILKKAEFLQDEITAVQSHQVSIKSAEITFEFLVICTGSSYPIFLEDTRHAYSLKSVADAEAIHKALESAEKLLVVGGGLIGTEIAAELVTKTKKIVTIIDLSERLLSRNSEAVSKKAQSFFGKKAKLMLGEKIVSRDINVLTTDKGTKFEADIIIWCAGIAANSQFLGSDFRESLSEQKLIITNESLQVKNHPHIFAGGDITALQEEKTAQTAEKHADVIAHNVIAAIKNKKMKTYAPKQRLMVISLGDWNGIIAYRNFSVSGMLAGILKKAIEMRELIKFGK